MILSVSRRTDIPNYYADWFIARIKEGYVYVRNPMNTHQISSIKLSPDVVDCIVFWTKNPGPMLGKLDELAGYQYYFQFTLTGYGIDIERNIPHKRKVMISVFQELAKKIGRERVIWRYDPIIFTDKYDLEYHLKAFGQIAGELDGYTEKCVISFVDIYAKNRKNMSGLKPYFPEEKALLEFGRKMAVLAGRHGIRVSSCAEKMDLSTCGIEHNCCIDKKLIEKITGYRIHAEKDKSQRPECECAQSIDIGTYNTCKSGCVYCYANHSQESVFINCQLYDVNSPLLCGDVSSKDKITERKIKSLRDNQRALWDL